MDIMASINQSIDGPTAEKIANKHNVELTIEKREKRAPAPEKKEDPDPEDIVYDDAEVDARPPIIAFTCPVDGSRAMKAPCR